MPDLALTKTLLTATLLLACSSPHAYAQLANRKDTLQGHKQVYVTVTLPETEEITRELGLRKASLERYVLERLKEKQVPASTSFTDQTLILEIRVDLHEVLRADDKRVYAFISQFDAVQAVRLATNRQSTLAATWRSSQFGAVSRDQAHLLRDSVIHNLNAFIADWQAAQQDAAKHDQVSEQPQTPTADETAP